MGNVSADDSCVGDDRNRREGFDGRKVLLPAMALAFRGRDHDDGIDAFARCAQGARVIEVDEPRLDPAALGCVPRGATARYQAICRHPPHELVHHGTAQPSTRSGHQNHEVLLRRRPTACAYWSSADRRRH